MTGALLARAHAHSADPRLIAGYCGKNEELDEAIAAFAVAYADRTEADHADLWRRYGPGRIAAETGAAEPRRAARRRPAGCPATAYARPGARAARRRA